ncbi:MAG: hypothetical protein U0871_22965 [Gemmataceae bacterium]
MPVRLPLIISLLTALAAGCGGGSATVAPALTVTVTLDGKPAGNLGVVLVPDGSADTAGGFGGTTDSTGRATLYGPNPGAVPPGKYKVVVTDRGPETDEPVAKKPVNRVPAVFGKPAATPLSLTVEAGKSEYPIEVRSKG